MAKNIFSAIILLTLFITPFLTSALNELSPFEFIKLFVISMVTITMAVAYLLLKIKDKRIEFRWNTGLSLLAFLLFVNFLSFLYSTIPYASFWADINVPSDSFFTILIFFVFCYLVSQIVTSESDFKRINFVLISVATSLASYGIVQHFGLDPVDWWGYSQMRVNAYGTIGQAVGFGTIVGAFLPVVLVSYLNSGKKWLSGLLLVCVAAVILGVMYSGSRGPAVGAAAVLLLGLGLFVFKNRNRKSLKKLGWVLLVVGICQAVYFMESEKTTLTQKMSGDVVSTGLSERTYIWQDAITIWKKYPLLGSGPETFGTQQKMVNRKEHNQYEHWELTWTKAHNHYIHHLATTGLLGLLAELALIFFLLFDLFKLVRKKEFNSDDLMAAGYALGFLFLCATNLTAFNFVLTQLYSYLLPTLYFILRSLPQPKIAQLRAKPVISIPLIIAATALLGLLAFSLYSYWWADVLFGRSKREFLINKNSVDSLRAIDEAIQIQPFNPRLYCRKATIITAMVTNAPGKYSEAELTDTVRLIDELSDTCVNLEPTNAEDWSIRAKLFAELFNARLITDYFQSEQGFLEAAKVNPNNPSYYFRLAVLYFSANRIEDYLKYMQLVVNLKTDYLPAYNDLLGFFYRRGDKAGVDRIVQRVATISINTGEYISDLKNMITLTEMNKDPQSKEILMKVYTTHRYLE